MAINNFFCENVDSIENEEIQQNEQDQTFEGNENPENVQRNLFGEFDAVASETEEHASDNASDQEDDSSDGIVDENLLHWNDINFSWDIDNVTSLIYGINFREDVTNLSINEGYILFDWENMNFYFELLDDGVISMEISINRDSYTRVHQSFMISMETENRVKRLIPIEHQGNYHRNDDCTNAIGDLFPHIDVAQFLN